MSEYKDILDDVTREDGAGQQDTDLEEEEVREQEPERDDGSDSDTGHNDGGSIDDRVSNNDMETDSVWLSPMYTQEETFHMMRALESIITLSDSEGNKEQDENTDAPTDKVSA